MNYKLKCSCLYLYVSKWDTVLFARLCVSSQCDPAGSRLDHHWLGLRAIPARPQSSDGRGLKDKRSRQTRPFGQKPAGFGLLLPVKNEETETLPVLHCEVNWLTQPCHYKVNTDAHKRTLWENMFVFLICLFIYLFFYPAEQGLFQDMFNGMTLVSCQIFVSSVPL